MCIQNSAIIKGTIEVVDKCTCCKTEYPIFPIHVKSGEKQAIQATSQLNQSQIIQLALAINSAIAQVAVVDQNNINANVNP